MTGLIVSAIVFIAYSLVSWKAGTLKKSYSNSFYEWRKKKRDKGLYFIGFTWLTALPAFQVLKYLPFNVGSALIGFGLFFLFLVGCFAAYKYKDKRDPGKVRSWIHTGASYICIFLPLIGIAFLPKWGFVFLVAFLVIAGLMKWTRILKPKQKENLTTWHEWTGYAINWIGLFIMYLIYA